MLRIGICVFCESSRSGDVGWFTDVYGTRWDVFAEDGEVVAVEEFVGGRHADEFSA
jgi:hypothetical protein